MRVEVHLVRQSFDFVFAGVAFDQVDGDNLRRSKRRYRVILKIKKGTSLKKLALPGTLAARLAAATTVINRYT